MRIGGFLFQDDRLWAPSVVLDLEGVDQSAPVHLLAQDVEKEDVEVRIAGPKDRDVFAAMVRGARNEEPGDANGVSSLRRGRERRVPGLKDTVTFG